MPINFLDSFRPVVELKPGESCNWKKHFYTGAGKEVIGALEWFETKYPDAQRVIFPFIATVVRLCYRFGRKQGLARGSVDAVYEFLREKGIMTINQGSDRRPRFQVARHDDLCVREGNLCRFVGWGERKEPDSRYRVTRIQYAPRPPGYKGHWPGDDDDPLIRS